MNPYQWPATCSVCGGNGLGTSETAAIGFGYQPPAARKFGPVRIVHVNPSVCRSVLDAERRRLREQVAAFAQSIGGIA